MVDRRVPGPASAPNPARSPRYGEDALSYLLGDSSDSDDGATRARVTKALDPERAVPITELSRTANVDFVELAKILDELRDEGRVEVEGDPGEEQVRAVG